MDLTSKLIDTTKKGTIIFSHYRSGGTQLKLIVRNVLNDIYKINCKDGGELDFNFDKLNFREELDTNLNFKWWKNNFDHLEFKDDDYGVLLVNNPFAIQWIRQHPLLMEKLKRDYCLIGVTRRDKIKSMLSLPLWVRFIDSGLFENQAYWTEEAMKKFHDNTIKNPIDWRQIHLGYFSVFEDTENSAEHHLNHMLRHLIDEFTILKLFCQELNTDLLYYEDYEFDKNYLVDFLPQHDRVKSIIEATYKGKIPYVSSDYSVYYEDIVKETIKYWRIK